MVCTFGDTHRRDLVARPAAADPAGASAGTAGCWPTRRPGSPRPAGRVRRAGRADRVPRPGSGWPSCCARPGALRGEPRADPAPGEVLRERATRRWRSSPPGSGTCRNGGRDPELRDALLARGRELGWHPAHMRARVRELGGRADRRLAGQPAALLRRADPGLVPAGRRRPAATTTRPIAPADDALPVDPAADAAARLRRGPARPARRVHRPTRTCMDTWATSSLTPQIAGGWAADDDLFDRVFPMDLRPQAHEIIRTWLFYTRAALARSRTACCPGGTRRSPAGSWTRTARRCPSPRATW